MRENVFDTTKSRIPAAYFRRKNSLYSSRLNSVNGSFLSSHVLTLFIPFMETEIGEEPELEVLLFIGASKQRYVAEFRSVQTHQKGYGKYDQK